MLTRGCGFQGQMMSQDKLEKERMDSKNAVEEYVYDMRDKLSSLLESYIKEKVCVEGVCWGCVQLERWFLPEHIQTVYIAYSNSIVSVPSTKITFLIVTCLKITYGSFCEGTSKINFSNKYTK